MFFVSLSTLNFDLPLCELVRKQVIKNYVDTSCASFLCILALSSVCNRSICSLYGTLKKSCLEIYLIKPFIQGGTLPLVNQTSIYYFVDSVSQDSIKGTAITNFKETILYQLFLLMQAANVNKTLLVQKQSLSPQG